MMTDTEALRFELSSEAAHWRTAVVGLSDVENFAAAQAWPLTLAFLNTYTAAQEQRASARS